MAATLPTNRYLHQVSPTPLVPVRLDLAGPTIWCKLEFLNPSGSTKDRIARYILEKAWRRGELTSQSLVVEASSGSTSIAMALTCAQLGVRFLAVMPEGVSNERVAMIQAFGGAVQFTHRDQGVRGAIAATEQLARDDPRVFLPRQFTNLDNVEAHRLGTAREILDQIPDGRVNAIVSGVGTGGTLVGIYQGWRDLGCDALPVLARPIHHLAGTDIECSCFSSRIPGVVEALSTLFQPEQLPGLVTIEVNDADALDATRRLHRLGFPVGPSSGLNYTAAILAMTHFDQPDTRVVTIFPDRMERYFSTELFTAAPRGCG